MGTRSPRIELAATRNEEVLLRRIRMLEELLRKIAEHSIDGWARAEAREILARGGKGDK
jgi:hypothetical protein